MAGSPEAQRRHRAAERVILKRLKAEMPDVHAKWWAEAMAPVESTSPPGGEPASVESTVPDLLENLARSFDAAHEALKRHRKGQHWTGYAWVDD